jgi:S1-C subfamily serine protease
VLRFQPDGLPAALPADAASLRPGHVVLAIGNHEGAPIASLGIVAIAGPAWHSLRGGTIDSLIRLDLALSPAAEGGAVVDVHGRAANRPRAPAGASWAAAKSAVRGLSGQAGTA